MAHSDHRFVAQKERILGRLQQGPLTALEALSDLGVMRPAARIHDLRNDGHAIDREMITVINRFDEETRVARYSLTPEQNQPTYQGNTMSEALEANPLQTAGIIITADNINQRQAISVAVAMGLKDAGFTGVSVYVDKSDDPSRVDVTPENAESLLGSMKSLNPGLFDAQINIVGVGTEGAHNEYMERLINDLKDEADAFTSF